MLKAEKNWVNVAKYLETIIETIIQEKENEEKRKKKRIFSKSLSCFRPKGGYAVNEVKPVAGKSPAVPSADGCPPVQ
ncbi:jg22572 [Pararge aegeria aegeria]|uniref:Jg22572 protein n=1 Tax=Pararge aegeria aegeria TaxID=348720 RepID=A0A8S4QHX7_9NEOP|nr:jg22572 [Pararge aegeria aegeria]